MNRVLLKLFPTSFDQVAAMVVVLMLLVIAGFLATPTKCGGEGKPIRLHKPTTQAAASSQPAYDPTNGTVSRP